MTEQIEAELRHHLELWADVDIPRPDLVSLEREGRARAARRRGWVAAAAAAVAVVVTIASVSWVLRDGGEVAPAPPVDTPTSGPDQSPPPSTGADPTNGPTQVGSPETLAPTDRSRWLDGQDTEVGAIDIREVRSSISGGQPYWGLELSDAYPTPTTPAAPSVIEYGLVIDVDGDRLEDCRIGISDDTSEPGEFRVWVENLRTGVSDDRTGPPYGIPIDFAHPTERSGRRAMTFFFVPVAGEPCGRLGPSSAFYAWSTAFDQGLVVAQDVAPDAAWLAMPS